MALPSFNIEQEHDSGKNRREGKGKKEKIRALTKTSVLGVSSERGQAEFITGQRQEIDTGRAASW